jgi:hypothetical protein
MMLLTPILIQKFTCSLNTMPLPLAAGQHPFEYGQKQQTIDFEGKT